MQKGFNSPTVLVKPSGGAQIQSSCYKKTQSLIYFQLNKDLK